MQEYAEYLVDDTTTADADASTIVRFWVKAEQHYPTLTKVVKALMTFPHSNASSERLFSMLKKINTEQRSNLCKSTIHALLSFKVNNVECCFDHTFKEGEIKKLKASTSSYNEAHSSSSDKAE